MKVELIEMFAPRRNNRAQILQRTFLRALNEIVKNGGSIISITCDTGTVKRAYVMKLK